MMQYYQQELSSQQQSAFDLIHSWYGNNPDAPFVLRGYAGTGKTYCIQRVIKSLRQLNPKIKIAVCAPTHRAVHVLEEMAAASLLKVDITTLHSLLHVMPGEYDETGRPKLKPNKWSREGFYSEYHLVVIDEASMVGEELMALIERKNTPTIFMGDPAQLPPIGEEESPVFKLATGYELTQVMRYSGAIADYVTSIRNGLNAQFPPRVRTYGNITKCNQVEWDKWLLDEFHQATDPYAVRAIAWTNRRVNAINKLIRESIQGVGDWEPYIKGERLVAKEPVIVRAEHDSERKVILMHSCAECEVKAVTEDALPYRNQYLHVYRLNIETDLGTKAWVLTIHPQSWETAKKMIFEWKKEILAMESEKRKKAWAAFYEFLETFNLVTQSRGIANRLNYAYATTCHQSQGGTFKKVFVDHSNIFGCRDVRMRNQLLYVADSRASEHLYALTKF